MDERFHELCEFVSTKAVKRGEFTLASGRRSSYYIDGKLITFDPAGSCLVVAAIQRVLEEFPLVGAIGGLDMGATPIAAAYAALSHNEGRPLSAFVVRKDRKEHGTRKLIEGIATKGSHVAVVDDVVTSGDSIAKAIHAVREGGCIVDVAISIVDRMSGAEELLASLDVPYHPLLSIQDLGLSNEPANSENLQTTH